MKLTVEPGILDLLLLLLLPTVPKDDEDEAAANLLAMRPICPTQAPLMPAPVWGTEGEGATKQPTKTTKQPTTSCCHNEWWSLSHFILELSLKTANWL